jgi:hypothetical protein
MGTFWNCKIDGEGQLHCICLKGHMYAQLKKKFTVRFTSYGHFSDLKLCLQL